MLKMNRFTQRAGTNDDEAIIGDSLLIASALSIFPSDPFYFHPKKLPA